MIEKAIKKNFNDKHFYQNILWDQHIPHPDGDIRVADWDELLKEIDYSKFNEL